MSPDIVLSRHSGFFFFWVEAYFAILWPCDSTECPLLHNIPEVWGRSPSFSSNVCWGRAEIHFTLENWANGISCSEVDRTDLVLNKLIHSRKSDLFQLIEKQWDQLLRWFSSKKLVENILRVRSMFNFKRAIVFWLSFYKWKKCMCLEDRYVCLIDRLGYNHALISQSLFYLNPQ